MTEKIIAVVLILGTAGLWASTALKGSPEPTPIVSTAPEIVIPQPPAPDDKILTPGIDYPFPPAAGQHSSHAAPAPSVPTSAGAVFVNTDCASGNCGPARGGPIRFAARRFSERRFRPLQRLFGRRR